MIPDYYATLDIPPTASSEQIKTAYKRASLRTHPDRFPPEQRTPHLDRAFHRVADAYFTLSDKGRRAAYDRLRKEKQGRRGNTNAKEQEEEEEEEDPQFQAPDAEGVFGDVFEEMMRPEVNSIIPFWTYSGALAGGVVGFIAGNVPGAVIGALGGRQLGKIRDAKGKAVYEVYKDLGGEQKAAVIKALVLKVFGMTGLPGSH